MTSPPRAQELRARGTGHVILNSELDRPWSQYFCCMLIGNADFVRRNPIATKRVVRAMMRATDICAAKPDWVAQRLVDRGLTTRYNYARQGLEDVSYRAWRDYDAEDAVRFWALRERELGHDQVVSRQDHRDGHGLAVPEGGQERVGDLSGLRREYSGEARAPVETLFSTQQRANVGPLEGLAGRLSSFNQHDSRVVLPRSALTAPVEVGGRPAVIFGPLDDQDACGPSSSRSSPAEEEGLHAEADRRGRTPRAPAHRNVRRSPTSASLPSTTEIRGVADFIRSLPGFHSLFEGYGPTSRSMSFPTAIIVEGVPAQPRRRRIWRVQMRDQRRRRVGTGPHGQRRRRAYVATFRFGKVQPSSPSACRAAASRSARHSA